LRLIKEFEAGPQGNSRPALMPYRCPAGKWTNGWGNTLGVEPGVAITLARAEADLRRNLDWAEACVEQYAAAPNDNEFAAMVSLCFNVGADRTAGFPGSTVLRLHNRGDKAGAAAAFAMWRKMRDPRSGALVDSAGLLRRRNVEANLYLTPVTEPIVAIPLPQAVVPERATAASRTVIAGGVAVASGAASVADQIDQVVPMLNRLSAAGASVESILKLGATALSVVALAAAGYMLWRYIRKRRRGEVLST
jgi:lysozyme